MENILYYEPVVCTTTSHLWEYMINFRFELHILPGLDLQLWGPLSVKTNLGYDKYLWFLFLKITKNTNLLFVILEKQMSQWNLWILFLFLEASGRSSQSLLKSGPASTMFNRHTVGCCTGNTCEWTPATRDAFISFTSHKEYNPATRNTLVEREPSSMT
jgi:hypothetical protein